MTSWSSGLRADTPTTCHNHAAHTPATESRARNLRVKNSSKHPHIATVCGLPPEYCEYGSTGEACRAWAEANCPEVLAIEEGIAGLEVWHVFIFLGLD